MPIVVRPIGLEIDIVMLPVTCPSVTGMEGIVPMPLNQDLWLGTTPGLCIHHQVQTIVIQVSS